MSEASPKQAGATSLRRVSTGIQAVVALERFISASRTDGAYLGAYGCANRVERRIHCGFERLACPARPGLNREKIEHRRADLT